MFILVMIVVVNTHVSVTTTKFDSNTSCLRAIGAVLDLENDNVKIKAKCVAK